MKRCSKCVLPEIYPGITFDEDGVCSVCLSYKKKEVLGEDKLRKEIGEILSAHKGKGGKYDCIVTTGGGRDSTYVLYVAKKAFNLNVLAINWDNGFRHPQAEANLKRACEILNADYITAGSKLNTPLLRSHLMYAIPFGPEMTKQRICYPCMAGAKFFVYRTAIEKNIPIVLWGYAQPEVFSFEDRLREKEFFDSVRIRNRLFSVDKLAVLKWLYYICRLRIELWTPKTGILGNMLDIKGSAHRLDKNKNIREFCLYDYIEWDRRKIKDTLTEELDWKKPEEKVSSWRYDCHLHHTLVNHCFKAMMGFDDNVDGYANMVRLGYMSRETALKQIELEDKQDHAPETRSILEELKIPNHLIDKFLSYSYTKHK